MFAAVQCFAVNIEDYVADGLGEWFLKGRYTNMGETFNATLEITANPMVHTSGYDYRYVFKAEGSQIAMREETITYEGGAAKLCRIAGDGFGVLEFNPMELYPIEPEPLGTYSFFVKKENKERRVWLDWGNQFKGFKEVVFRGEKVEALVLEQEVRRREYDPVPNNNWRHDLIEDVTERWLISYIQGYGPVSIDVTRTIVDDNVSHIEYGTFTLDSHSQWQNFVFEDAKEIFSGVWQSPWLGIFDASAYPEIEHIAYGTMEFEGEQDDFWIKLPMDLGWANSSVGAWPRAWISGLRGYYRFSEQSTPETLFFQDDYGTWIAVTEEKIEQRSPVDPVARIILPLTGNVDVSVTGSITLTAVIDNIPMSRIRNAYFVKGGDLGSPILGNATISARTVNYTHNITEEEIDTELVISVVFMDVDGNEWISKPVRLAVRDDGARSPEFGITEINTTARTGELFVYELTTSIRAEFEVISGALPDGVDLVENPSGKTAFLTGIPTTPGMFQSMIRASNANGASDLLVSIEVSEGNKPLVVSAKTAYGSVGQSFYYRVEIKDSTKHGAIEISTVNSEDDSTEFVSVDEDETGASSFPKGLQFDPSQGVLWGVPTMAGNYQVPIFIKNTYGTTEFVLQVVVSP